MDHGKKEEHGSQSIIVEVEDGGDVAYEAKRRGTSGTERKAEGLASEASALEISGDTEELPPKPEGKSKRVATLDAFRGLTVVLMILVDDSGGAYEKIDHSPWNGCRLADFVMPFFLFIVGVAIAFAFKRVPSIPKAIRRVITRTLKLVFWGLILQGGYSHAPDQLVYGVDMKKIRWCGILQRIALVYLVVATIEILTVKLRPAVLASDPLAIFNSYRWQWLGGFVAFIVYMVTTYSLYVPDWSFVFYSPGDVNDGKRYTVPCGVRGSLGPACNAAGYIDRQVWGINHLYSRPVWIRSQYCTYDHPNPGPLRLDAAPFCLAPFEPEGLLSTISAVLSGTIGIHYGHVLVHFKLHKERLMHWVPMSLTLLAVGVVLHFTNAIPLNKQLYSSSYVCFTAGAAGIVFSGLYLMMDVWKLRTPFLFLEWIGMNAMLVFVLGAAAIFPAFINGWYYEDTNNTLIYWIQKHIFNNVWHSQRLGTLLYVIFAEIVFWAVVAGICHKLGIYWKL